MPAAFTHTTAPTLWRAAVTSASRNLRARPPLPTPIGGRAGFPIGRADVDVAAKADDISKADALQELEQFDVAEAAVGQDRHGRSIGQQRLQAGQAQVLEIVALVFNSSLSTVSQMSGVALPWRVMRCSASVD